tara:strand:- start:820 stop:1029 length:210 start_codon:yes stop_codon:yes gene_type:complete
MAKKSKEEYRNARRKSYKANRRDVKIDHGKAVSAGLRNLIPGGTIDNGKAVSAGLRNLIPFLRSNSKKK